VKARHEQEFAEYFEARRSAVRRSAYLLCGDWHRADDLAQVAFIALYRNWQKIREPAAVDAYLRRTLVRAVIDESRRPWRRETSVDEVVDQAASNAMVDELVTRDEVLAALNGVPPRQRAVLVLRFYEDLDVAATARALDCSEGTVKSQTARGLANLKTQLQGLTEVIDRD
jgi:RNA polymerase sigma-70 factor (sigma-E family)